MKIIEFVRPNNIHLHSNVHTRDEAIRLMIEEIYKNQAFTNQKPDVKKMIQSKNLDGGPVFGNGLSVYIWRAEEVKDLIVSMCLPKKPIIIENSNISLITLIVTASQPLKSYVDVIYDLIMISENNPSMFQLTQAATTDDFIRALKSYPEE